MLHLMFLMVGSDHALCYLNFYKTRQPKGSQGLFKF